MCKNLACIDQIDGEYTDKRRFIIFDYCGNFEFFREHKEGFEGRETKSLSENIFDKRIKLIALLQESAYDGQDFQSWRAELMDICHEQVTALNQDLTAVRLRLRYRKSTKSASLSNTSARGTKAN